MKREDILRIHSRQTSPTPSQTGNAQPGPAKSNILISALLIGAKRLKAGPHIVTQTVQTHQTSPLTRGIRDAAFYWSICHSDSEMGKTIKCGANTTIIVNIMIFQPESLQLPIKTTVYPTAPRPSRSIHSKAINLRTIPIPLVI